MDPDLVRNKKYSGQGADVWALGVILFLLITGGVPFWGETEQDLYRRISSGKFSLPNKGKNHSKKLLNLLNKIFVSNVNNRISAEKILDDPGLRKPGDKKKSKMEKDSFNEDIKHEE